MLLLDLGCGTGDVFVRLRPNVDGCQGFWTQVAPGASDEGSRLSLAVEPERARARQRAASGLLLFPTTIELIAALTRADGVDAVMVRGSASYHLADDMSDDDVVVVVDLLAEVPFEIRPRRLVLTVPDGPGTRVVCDTTVQSVASLRRLRQSNSDTDRWPFEQTRVIHARDRRAKSAVGQLASMDPAFRELRIRHGFLDVVLAADRARTCEARGQVVENRLILSRGTRALSRVLFALEWRWVPLDQWLTFGLSTLHDRADCSQLVADVLQELSWRPLLEAERRLRPVLQDLLPSLAWDRPSLWSALRGPGAREQRSTHGLC